MKIRHLNEAQFVVKLHDTNVTMLLQNVPNIRKSGPFCADTQKLYVICTYICQEITQELYFYDKLYKKKTILVPLIRKRHL